MPESRRPASSAEYRRRGSLSFAATAIASHRVTARALAEAQLARMAATDGAIGAWSALDPSHVRREAERCDAAESDAPLAGIGVGVKDSIATRALPTEMGSPIFAGHRPAADAACIARLIAAGGYVFGADLRLLSVASWCEERLPFVGLG